MSVKQYLVDAAIILKNLIDVDLALFLQRSKSRFTSLEKELKRFLIIPGDPVSPSSSMGDIAMLAGLMQALKLQHPGATFTLLGSDAQIIKIPEVGEVKVVPAWQGRKGTIAFAQLLKQHTALFGIGADVMDGKYGAALVCRLASYCNHAAEQGLPVTIVGFSFNGAPRRPSIYALSHLNPKICINVRDQLSLNRFNTIVGKPANLCTDVAFLMPPSTEEDPISDYWIKAVRASGFKPIGVNINAHALAHVISEIGIESVINKIARELATTAAAGKLAYILIAHDIKPQAGDILMLKLLEKCLNKLNVTYVINITPINPAQIKRICGYLDLVITGRMHLAIAALGMGTPTLCITYQDKFEGLYKHFNLPETGILISNKCITNELSILILNQISQLQELKYTISITQKKIIQLALINTNATRFL